MNTTPRILVLGVGNILFSDEGFGVHVITQLDSTYRFSENVSIVDGGVLGLNLLGFIHEADYLIVVDAVRNHGNPGDFHRLEGEAIPGRIRAKNSLHQVDLLESLTMCQALDHVPKTVILGVEPADIETMDVELTPVTRARVDEMIERVLGEVTRLGGRYELKTGTEGPG